MPNKNGELSPKELQVRFRALSLQDLCYEAYQILQILESNDDEDGLFLELQQYLTEATQAKVDGYCWIEKDLKAEIDEWETKKKRLARMCDEVIERKQKQLDGLKQNLLRLAEFGLIDDYLIGYNKAIEIRPNPKPTVEVFKEADVPEIYRQPKIQWTVDKQAIAQAHQAGKDVSAFARVTYGKQVRFKNAPRKKRKTNEDEL